MRITEAGRSLIKEYEGLALKAYRCPAGKLTIGYGHTGPDVKDGDQITEADAERLLAMDLDRFERGVDRLCARRPTPAQFSAMVCLAYNIGLGNFAKSSVLRLHNAGDFVGAARAFALWNKATGADGKKRELRGLTRRRAAEAALYLSDDGLTDEQRTRAADVEPEKPLTKSKTIIGSAVGGTAVAASEAASWLEHIDWARDQLYGLAPYLPIISNVLVVLGLLGIGVALYARWKDRRDGRN